MPYFYNDKIVNILFIHIPKTGGTSVETYLSKKYNIELNEKSLFIYKKHFMNASYQHQLYINIKNNKDFFNINFNEIFIFTVVRNPYDRIVSDLFFLKIINDVMSTENICSVIKDEYLIKSYDNHSIPQHLFLLDEDGEINENIKILKTETLNEDMYNLGYKDFKNHLYKIEKKKNTIDYLNSESIRIINDYYDRDFLLFGYDKLTP